MKEVLNDLMVLLNKGADEADESAPQISFTDEVSDTPLMLKTPQEDARGW
jgi:hypothetical protein